MQKIALNPKTTEIIYVNSPDYEEQLFTSMRSLLFSGTSFDKIIIYCVGERPKYWDFIDPRITVEEFDQSSLDNNFFHLIKTVCIPQRKAERVIYLDSDTLVMKPLDSLWEQYPNCDLIARPASAYGREDWDQENWIKLLDSLNASFIPYLNAGFLIFQNGSHEKLKNIWSEYTLNIFANKLMKIERPDRFSEQYALALAAASQGFSVGLLDSSGQAFGWLRESAETTHLFHTGGFLFRELAEEVERYLGTRNLDLPTCTGLNRLNPVHIKRRVKYSELYKLYKKIKAFSFFSSIFKSLKLLKT